MSAINWEDGSREQQAAAVATASVINTLEREKINMTHVSEVLIAMNEDLQIRDYALGLIDSERLDHFEDTFRWLTTVAPDDMKSAPACMLAAVLYEKGKKSSALEALTIARSDYSLATLLNRVFQSDAHSRMLAIMREELHPQVCAVIFGEDA